MGYWSWLLPFGMATTTARSSPLGAQSALDNPFEDLSWRATRDGNPREDAGRRPQVGLVEQDRELAFGRHAHHVRSRKADRARLPGIRADREDLERLSVPGRANRRRSFRLAQSAPSSMSPRPKVSCRKDGTSVVLRRAASHRSTRTVARISATAVPMAPRTGRASRRRAGPAAERDPLEVASER